MSVIHPPRHIAWSSDEVDLSDPFQRRWYLRQVLTHGRVEDIRSLNLAKIEGELENLDLPPEVYSLWKSYLKPELVEG
jgi:hypothetical protein